jgi:K+-sensing histidine kinase KdpD
LDLAALQENISFAKELGARVVKLKSRHVAEALIDFARREGITHVILGQTQRSRLYFSIAWLDHKSSSQPGTRCKCAGGTT